MNPLLTVRGAITSGFVAAIVLSLLISPSAAGLFHRAGWWLWSERVQST